ncbi:MAG: hypothetical protein WBA91_11160, partial [Paracoccaceae bacterium]
RVVERARTVLEALEQGERTGGTGKATLIDDLPLFSAAPAAPPVPRPPKGPSPMEERIAALNPDELTPLQALAALYDLKRGLAKD